MNHTVPDRAVFNELQSPSSKEMVKLFVHKLVVGAHVGEGSVISTIRVSFFTTSAAVSVKQELEKRLFIPHTLKIDTKSSK